MARLRFMSWNWNCFTDNRNDRKAGLIERLAPDVVALQEIDERAVQDIARLLPGWALTLPDAWSASGWPRARGQKVPSVALLAKPGTSLHTVESPDLAAWRTAEARDGLGFDPDFEREDDAFPGPQSFVGASVRVAGRDVHVVSAHGPHAAGRDPELVRLRILLKRRTFAVLRHWTSGRSPLVLGMDANAWVDSGLARLDDALTLEPGNPQNDISMFVQNGYLAGCEDLRDPKDAFRIWLDAHPAEQVRIKAKRPFGPWATTYNRSMNHPRPDRRDLVMVSEGVGVVNVEHDYEDSLAAGSDHSYVLADLEI